MSRLVYKFRFKFNLVENICGNMVEGKNCSENSLCTVSSDGRELLGCDCTDGYLGSGFICKGIIMIYVAAGRKRTSIIY